MSDIHFGKHEQNQHLFQMNISMKPSKIHLMVIIIPVTEKLGYHKTVNLHHPCQLVYIISAFPVQSTKASSCTSSQCKQANFLVLFYTLVFVCFVLFFILFFTFFICQTTWISYKPSWFSQERLPARQAHNAIKQTFVVVLIFFFRFQLFTLKFQLFNLKYQTSLPQYYFGLPGSVQLCVFLCQFYQAALFSQQRQPGSHKQTEAAVVDCDENYAESLESFEM